MMEAFEETAKDIPMKLSVNKEKIIKAFYNEKRLAVIFVVLFVLSLLPMLSLASYSHPGVDDFGYGADTRTAFVTTHNALAVLGASIATVVEIYHTWQGTYSTTFLATLNLAVFNETFYPMTTYIMLLMLIGSTIFLLHTILVRILGLEKNIVVLTGIPILFFCTQSLPSPREGFFWNNGAMAYTFFYGLMLFLLGLCIHLYISDTARGGGGGVYKAVVAAVLCLLIGGGNYITALLSVLLLTAMAATCFVFRRPTLTKATFVALLLILLAGFLANVLAPGNTFRQIELEQANGIFRSGAIAAILNSLRDASQDVDLWLLHDFRIMSALLFLSPIYYRMAMKSNYPFKYPLLVIFVSFCFFAAGYAPNNYASPGWMPLRVVNVLYFTFVLLVFLDYFYLVGYMARLVREQQLTLSRGLLLNCAYVACLFALIFVLSSTSRYREHTSIKAARDLYNGTAKQYSWEWNEYYRVLHDDSIKQVELPPLSAKPELLSFSSISPDKNAWGNQDIARFYQKEYVFVNEDLKWANNP
jgi:hypothetical protein